MGGAFIVSGKVQVHQTLSRHKVSFSFWEGVIFLCLPEVKNSEKTTLKVKVNRNRKSLQTACHLVCFTISCSSVNLSLQTMYERLDFVLIKGYDNRAGCLTSFISSLKFMVKANVLKLPLPLPWALTARSVFQFSPNTGRMLIKVRISFPKRLLSLLEDLLFCRVQPQVNHCLLSSLFKVCSD